MAESVEEVTAPAAATEETAAGSSSVEKPAEATGITRSVLRQIECARSPYFNSAPPRASWRRARLTQRGVCARARRYYFSDSNYPKDKFLMAEVAKSEEGWVGLSVIANFNKVKGLVPDGSVTTIAEALSFSNFLEVSADGASVRRPGIVKKTVKLGTLEFHSRDEVVTHARALIAEGDAAEGGAVNEDGQAFVTSLLELHEKAAEKRGEGEFTIKVGRNPDFPDTSCFVIARADGTEVSAPRHTPCIFLHFFSRAQRATAATSFMTHAHGHGRVRLRSTGSGRLLVPQVRREDLSDRQLAQGRRRPLACVR